MKRKTLSVYASKYKGSILEKRARDKDIPLATYVKTGIGHIVSSCEKSESYQLCLELFEMRRQITDNFTAILQFCEIRGTGEAAYERAKEAAEAYSGCGSRLKAVADKLYGNHEHLLKRYDRCHT